MKKQLMFIPPNNIDIDEWRLFAQYVSDQFENNYPIVLLPDWDYDVVKIDEVISDEDEKMDREQ